MERTELIRRLVLNSLCDDYENVDQIILPQVARYATKLGVTVTREDIVEMLGRLVGEGMAKAYLLSAIEPHCIEIDGMPSLDLIEENFQTYFYVTQKGMDLHLVDEWWPFDENDNLRTG